MMHKARLIEEQQSSFFTKCTEGLEAVVNKARKDLAQWVKFEKLEEPEVWKEPTSTHNQRLLEDFIDGIEPIELVILVSR
jgi:hypothetical protein